ncbi:MAG: hypothetical protein AB7D49_06910 [Arcobacter sp.]|uniref:hypothetical protein n=1 Tax=Arcobacter sp. TaxID=1872629 RepID=UPI003D12F6EC
MQLNEELNDIIFLLEIENFIEAHNKLEELWKKYKNDEKTREESFILKAFVNASVSFELLKIQRFEHASNVWNTYKKYEDLIEKLYTTNSKNYKKIKEIVYKKREKYIK